MDHFIVDIVGELKRPRGFIRLIQAVFGLLTFTIIFTFSTQISITPNCIESQIENQEIEAKNTIGYRTAYPFDFPSKKFAIHCNKTLITGELQFFYDASPEARFFGAISTISWIYALVCLLIYAVYRNRAESQPAATVGDFVSTSILTVFWFASSCILAGELSAIKEQSSVEHIKSLIHASFSKSEYSLIDQNDPSWTNVHISLICGFSNFVLWAASIWFVYKETVFHRPSHVAMIKTSQRNLRTADSSNMRAGSRI